MFAFLRSDQQQLLMTADRALNTPFDQLAAKRDISALIFKTLIEVAIARELEAHDKPEAAQGRIARLERAMEGCLK